MDENEVAAASFICLVSFEESEIRIINAKNGST